MNELKFNIITKYIETQNITIKEFCKQCNISTSTYYRIMKGKDFNLISLFRIAKKMNIRIHIFFK